MNVTITITVPVGAAAPGVATEVTSDVAASPASDDEPPEIPAGAEPPEPEELIGTTFVPPTADVATERPVVTEVPPVRGAEPPSLEQLGLAEPSQVEIVGPPSVEEIMATEASAGEPGPPAIVEVAAAEVSDVGPPDVDVAGLTEDLPDVAPDEEPPPIEELQPPAGRRKAVAKRSAGQGGKK